jgi:hypothetical protein
MPRDLFLAILRGPRDYNPYFICKLDPAGKLGFTSYQNCLATIHMMAYGVHGDLTDKYLRMSEIT